MLCKVFLEFVYEVFLVLLVIILIWLYSSIFLCFIVVDSDKIFVSILFLIYGVVCLWEWKF